MPINLPTYEQQQQVITLLQELGLDVATLLTGRVVKSVQRGTVSLSNGAANSTINISKVDPSKSVIFTTGTTQITSSGGSSGVNGHITNTGLTITVSATINTTYTIPTSWQVIEFY